MAKPSKDHLDKFLEYGLNLETRTLCLFGEVDEGMADRAMKGLILLAADDAAKPVTIYLNSDGGSWTDGAAIYSFIKQMPYHITIKAYGACMSMATVILQAGDTRLVDRLCTFMIHHGSDSREDKQHTIDYERWADVSKYNRKQMCDIYAEKSSQKTAYWQRKCMHDYILTPEQVVEEGLADGLVE